MKPSDETATTMRRFADAYGTAYRAALGRVWVAPSQLDAICRGAPSLAHRGAAEHLATIAEWLDAQEDAPIASVIRGAFADSWMIESGYPLARIAVDPGRFAAPPKPPKPVDRLAGAGPEPALDRAARDLDAQIASRKAEAVTAPVDIASMLKLKTL